MRISVPSRIRPAFVAALLAGGLLRADEAPKPEKAPITFVEAFQKGPILMSAKVVRKQGAGESVLPLFHVPVLQFEDRLEVGFSGEAFDPRVTSADWSLIVVFLPRTVAPTDLGVVDIRLKRKGGQMVVPPIPVPYDSIPMIFLLPDKNGRKKVLTDLTAHLADFRNLCEKIQSLSEERAVADTFLQNLDAIDKNLSPVAYDNAIQGFLQAYGTSVSADAQAFLSGGSSNLAKAQFMTQEFRKTNVLVPDAPAQSPVAASVTLGTGGERASSAYVSIFFDLALIIHNLWPGHQFQYLPALARNFNDCNVELYYSDWIRTTGEVRGALMCCPGKWSDLTASGFSFEPAPGESILKKEALLNVRPKVKDSLPFSLYGHDWKLLLTGPKGESLQPIPLSPSPNKQAFVVETGKVLDPLRKQGVTQVKGRIAGRWGFASIATDPVDLAIGCDPAWQPTPVEIAAFESGKACAFRLPGAWAGCVEKAQFRFAADGRVLAGTLSPLEAGARQVAFKPGAGDGGKGALELFAFGAEAPVLSRSLNLLQPPPEVTRVEARQGDADVVVRGRHLDHLPFLELGERRFTRVDPASGDPTARTFRPDDGKVLEGPLGKAMAVKAVLADGSKTSLEGGAAILPPRPKLGEIQISAVETKASALKLVSATQVAPSGAPSQVNLLAGKGYRFPLDRAFRVAFRNADDPGEIRLVPGMKIRVMGNNQKASLALNPAEVLGGRASGKLELQVQDEHAGASDWVPLPALFVDLPILAAFRATPDGVFLTGPALDPIEEVALAPEGPWQKLKVTLEEGQEVARLPEAAPGGAYWVHLFGWPDVLLNLKVPPRPAPAPKLPAPVETAPAEPKKAE